MRWSYCGNWKRRASPSSLLYPVRPLHYRFRRPRLHLYVLMPQRLSCHHYCCQRRQTIAAFASS
jgi:hypothetical protein